MKSRARQDSILTQSRRVMKSPDTPAEQIESTQKSKLRSAHILFVLAFLVAGSTLFIVKTRSTLPSQAIDLTNVEQRRNLEAAVNRHIQMTNRKIETDKERIKVEAAFAIPRVGHLVAGNRKEISGGRLDLRADRSEYNPARDLDRRGETSQTTYVANVVHNEMAEAELYKHAQEADRQEYARQYIEQARRNGYDVKIDSDFRIISVRELPREARQSAGEAFR